MVDFGHLYKTLIFSCKIFFFTISEGLCQTYPQMNPIQHPTHPTNLALARFQKNLEVQYLLSLLLLSQ
jgi:hypothetical protein